MAKVQTNDGGRVERTLGQTKANTGNKSERKEKSLKNGKKKFQDLPEMLSFRLTGRSGLITVVAGQVVDAVGIKGLHSRWSCSEEGEGRPDSKSKFQRLADICCWASNCSLTKAKFASWSISDLSTNNARLIDRTCGEEGRARLSGEDGIIVWVGGLCDSIGSVGEDGAEETECEEGLDEHELLLLCGWWGWWRSWWRL